jgi:hypothetical protein
MHNYHDWSTKHGFIRTQDVVFSKKETITDLPFVPIVSNAIMLARLHDYVVA